MKITLIEPAMIKTKTFGEKPAWMLRPRWRVDLDFKYGTPVFEPMKISAQGLAEKRMEMYRKFYGVKSTLYACSISPRMCRMPGICSRTWA